MMKKISAIEEDRQMNNKLQSLKLSQSPDELPYMRSMATSYQSRRLYDKSASLNRVILERVADNVPLASAARHNLAYDLKGLGKFTESEKMFRVALEGRTSLEGGM